jgi:recombination protein RecA
MYAEGISKEGDVLDLGVELDLIEKRGSFYSYNGDRLAQGRENTKDVLRENPALCIEIENSIRRETGLPELDLSPAFDFGDLEDDEVEEDVEEDSPESGGLETDAPEAEVLEAVSDEED